MSAVDTLNPAALKRVCAKTGPSTAMGCDHLAARKFSTGMDRERKGLQRDTKLLAEHFPDLDNVAAIFA